MKIRWFFFLVICVAVTQCAKQTAPTGGPKDETPPKLKESYPRHEQVNFKGDQIELAFDEHVQLNNPREQIIITPSAGKKFEVTQNKNRVTIKFSSQLQENTTYNINFRESIQDITEKNPAALKLAFSTGPYIDSLSINGKVIDALNEKPAANYTVALAEVSDSLNIFKHPASWLTLTNKSGVFSLENLKPGNYFLYTFDDKSKNLIVDSKNENYGFIAKTITLQGNLDSLKIKTFRLDVNPLKLITARTTFAYFNLRFSKSLIDYNIQAVDSTTEIFSSLEKDLTTIKLYNTIPDLDSLQIRVRATDSLNYKVDTLLYMKFPKKETTHDKLTATLAPSTLYESNAILSTQVEFSKPITFFQPDSMYIKIDSVTRIPFTEQDYQWQNKRMKLVVNKRLELKKIFPTDTTTGTNPLNSPAAKPLSKPVPKQIPTLQFSKGTFISLEKDTAQLLTSPLTLTKTDATAIVEVKVETSEDFIVQILNRSEKIIQQRINEKLLSFENLPADTYSIRLVIDLNKNGKWDGGNYFTKTEPEPVIFYRNVKGIKEIPLKANWQVGPLLIKY